MIKIPFAIFILIFSALVFASCDTGSSSHDVIHVNSAAAWNNALTSISDAPDGTAGSPNVFIIEITHNFNVPGISGGSSSIGGGYKEVQLTGGGTVSLESNGSLIRTAANQTFIIDGPTLQGISGNNTSLVYIASDSTVELRNGYVKGNTVTNYMGGGGVWVDQNGNFTMTGGEISDNDANNGSGGGVVVHDGSFTMTGGEISDNNANSGGGVVVHDGSFMMTGGEISGNTATDSGGGVWGYGGSFTMEGGEISDNNVNNGSGGGVYINNNFSFTMTGGKISGNTASYGGGVIVYEGSFTMSNSEISGNSASYGGGVYVYNNNFR
jgi:uncharacterized protein (AIM24 family)